HSSFIISSEGRTKRVRRFGALGRSNVGSGSRTRVSDMASPYSRPAELFPQKNFNEPGRTQTCALLFRRQALSSQLSYRPFLGLVDRLRFALSPSACKADVPLTTPATHV